MDFSKFYVGEWVPHLETAADTRAGVKLLKWMIGVMVGFQIAIMGLIVLD